MNYDVKCIPYNIKEKVEEKPNEGDGMTDQQFNQIMKRMDDGFVEVKVEIGGIKSEVKEMKVEINGIKESLVNLTEIVRKNHPKDFA